MRKLFVAGIFILCLFIASAFTTVRADSTCPLGSNGNPGICVNINGTNAQNGQSYTNKGSNTINITVAVKTTPSNSHINYFINYIDDSDPEYKLIQKSVNYLKTYGTHYDWNMITSDKLLYRYFSTSQGTKLKFTPTLNSNQINFISDSTFTYNLNENKVPIKIKIIPFILHPEALNSSTNPCNATTELVNSDGFSNTTHYCQNGNETDFSFSLHPPNNKDFFNTIDYGPHFDWQAAQFEPDPATFGKNVTVVIPNALYSPYHNSDGSVNYIYGFFNKDQNDDIRGYGKGTCTPNKNVDSKHVCTFTYLVPPSTDLGYDPNEFVGQNKSVPEKYFIIGPDKNNQHYGLSSNERSDLTKQTNGMPPKSMTLQENETFSTILCSFHFNWENARFTPDTGAILGRTVQVHIPDALNIPSANGTDCFDAYNNNSTVNTTIEPQSVRYIYGVIDPKNGSKIGYTAGDCSISDCYLSYTLPSIDELNSIKSGQLNYFIIGPNGDNQYPGLAPQDQFKSETNGVLHSFSDPKNTISYPGLTVDTAWSNIIANDPDGRKELNCAYETPPRACPFVKNPAHDKNPNAPEYKIDPSLSANSQDVIACHGSDPNGDSVDSTYICSNTDEEVACNTNPYAPTPTGTQANGAINVVPRSNIRCVERDKLVVPDPCHQHTSSSGNNLGETQCASVLTALGLIKTNPQQLISTIFGIFLSLAGGIALFLIIISGYRFMTSQGNPEALQAARDQLISAITGLLFIIFALVIYEVITSNLLHIPGFGQ